MCRNPTFPLFRGSVRSLLCVCLSLSVLIFVSVTKQHNYWLLMTDIITEKYQRTFLFLVKICCCFFPAFFLSLSIWSNLKHLAEFDYSAIASSINKGAYWHLYMSMAPLPQTNDVVIKFILISSLQRFFFLDQLRLLDFYSGKIWPSFSWMQTGCNYSTYCIGISSGSFIRLICHWQINMPDLAICWIVTYYSSKPLQFFLNWQMQCIKLTVPNCKRSLLHLVRYHLFIRYLLTFFTSALLHNQPYNNHSPFGTISVIILQSSQPHTCTSPSDP